MISLERKIVGVHTMLTSAALPHAFGGALALAFYTGEPRGTRDIDVNIFCRRARSMLCDLRSPNESHSLIRKSQML